MAGIEPDSSATMAPEDRLAHQFYSWELRGRGWQMWDLPVEPEPRFESFFGYFAEPTCTAPDDGHKHTLLSGVIDWLHRALVGRRCRGDCKDKDDHSDAEPDLWTPDIELVELQIAAPATVTITRDSAEQLLLTFGSCRRTPAFELVGTPDRIVVQIACDAGDAGFIRQQLEAHVPGAIVADQLEFLERRWLSIAEGEAVIAELGLGREFMLPLAPPPRTFSPDPLTSLLAVLSDVSENEIALLQLLFRPVTHPWAESVLRSVVLADGTPLFEDVRDYVKQARTKVSRPLYGAVVRVAARSGDGDRAWELARRLSKALATLNDAEGNELIPLSNDNYDSEDHEKDLLLRRSRRGGMLLNSEELSALVHLPSPDIQLPKLRGATRKTKAAPTSAKVGAILGENEHASIVRTVRLTPTERTRHLHLIGGSGTGKSTLLLNLILQDIAAGDGVAVLDPHGDLIDDVIARLPTERAEDVVLLDPADEDFPVGFNVLSAHSATEKNLLASDLVAVFKRLSTSWGDQMHSVLGNAILAFLESTQGGTLVDLRRFLVEPPYRKEFLTTVQDPEVVYYWTKEFPLLSGKPQGPVLTRLDTFLRPKPIRYMVGQRQSRIDFADVMDNGRVFLARLSHGAIGEENAHLLGTLLVTKFHQIALGRQRVAESSRRNFWLYVDEFHNFATPSMASILSGARKYHLGLVLAHQEMRQLEAEAPDVAGAVLANAHTRVCFRLGDEDARKLASGFSAFDAGDLQRLSTGEAICRIERADGDFNLTTTPPPPEDEAHAAHVRALVIETSRRRYATDRAAVERELASAYRTREDRPAPHPAADAPATTEKEMPPTAVSPPSPPTPPPPKPVTRRKTEPAPEPAPMGRGGPQHQYLQRVIKQYAEGLGFKASIEGPVGGSRGVDVALSRGAVTVACEICITTEPEHELGNVRKCLAGGYVHVVVVSVEDRRLEKLRTAIEPQLTDVERSRLHYFLPEELFAFLQELGIQQLSSEAMVRGYKVKTNFTSVNAGERDERRQAITRVVANAMRRVRHRNQ